MEEAAYNQQCAELEKIAKVPWNCEKKKGKKKGKIYMSKTQLASL